VVWTTIQIVWVRLRPILPAAVELAAVYSVGFYWRVAEWRVCSN